MEKVLEAILVEIRERKYYLKEKNIKTIYLGGGTPSILDIKALEKIFNQLAIIYEWDKQAEITIECNPEDINMEYLLALKNLGINRISLGVQSLNDSVLKWMGRQHSAKQCIESIKIIHKAGIENFSVDIIYGIPFYSKRELKKDLEYLLNLTIIPHISAYQLTVEPKTKLNYLVQKQKLIPADDEKIRNEFLMLHDILVKNNYTHYEISNYAQKGFIAQHNTAYWLQKPYCGIGPSAHSYNGTERRWNISNNYLYATKVLMGAIYFEKEILNEKQKFNEYIYTRLRTIYGCRLSEIENNFGEEYVEHFLNMYEKNKSYFNVSDGKVYVLNIEGYLMLDKIAVDFFCV